MSRGVYVVGDSGAGKTTFARRLAATASLRHVEMDALHHLPGWQERPATELRELFLQQVTRDGDGWVADGNYWTSVGDLVLEHADVVVWLDLPRRLAVRRVLLRTLRRGLTREALWHGNRESLRSLLSLDPAVSIVAWSWTQHPVYRARYAELSCAPGPRWVRVRTAAAAEVVLRELTAELRTGR